MFEIFVLHGFEWLEQLGIPSGTNDEPLIVQGMTASNAMVFAPGGVFCTT
jgi:hypothetical protein